MTRDQKMREAIMALYRGFTRGGTDGEAHTIMRHETTLGACALANRQWIAQRMANLYFHDLPCPPPFVLQTWRRGEARHEQHRLVSVAP